MLDRIAFATNAYTNGRWSIEEAIARIAKEGYRGVGILADRPLVWLPDLDTMGRRSIRETLKEAGVVVSSVNGFTAAGYYGELSVAPGQQFGPSFSDADEAMREWKVNYTKLVIDFAEELECYDVSFGSGYPPDGVERKVAWDWMREAIEEAVSYAKTKGVRLNLEYEPNLLVGGANDAARLLKEIFSPSLGLNFDTGHSFVCGEDVVAQICRFAPHINGVDIEDIGLDEEGSRVHAHMVPGEGVMPLETIFRAFFESEYKGWYTVELYNHFYHPVHVTKASMRALRKLARKLERDEREN